MASAGGTAPAMQPADAGAQPAGRGLVRRRSSAGNTRITQWQVTVQPARANVAHCFRCKQSFKPQEFRMQSYRSSEAATGKRNTDRYAHIMCLDVALPEPANIVGFGNLTVEQKQAFTNVVNTSNAETIGSRKQARQVPRPLVSRASDCSIVEPMSQASLMDPDGDVHMSQYRRESPACAGTGCTDAVISPESKSRQISSVSIKHHCSSASKGIALRWHSLRRMGTSKR